METRLPALVLVCSLVALLGRSSCGDNGSSSDNSGPSTAGDADMGSDGDADGDGDSDGAGDRDTDTDTDADGDLAPGCEVIASNTALQWEGPRGIDGDRMVWMEFDWDALMPTLYMRQLSTGETTTLIADPGYEEHPGILGDWVFWENETTMGEAMTRELFRMNLGDAIPQQLTDNDCSDANYKPGVDYIIHTTTCDGEEDKPLYYTDFATLTPTMIVADSVSSGNSGNAFDGERYVTWGWHTTSTAAKLYLFDLENPSPPSDPLWAGAENQVTPVIHNGKIYSGSGDGEGDEAENFDIWIYDIENQTYDWLDHALYDQLYADVDGNIVGYLDTEELEKRYFLNGSKSRVEIHDLETHLTRRLTNVTDNYHKIGISGQYLAFKVSAGATYLVVCDLLAGGHVDANGHICPASGCGDLPRRRPGRGK